METCRTKKPILSIGFRKKERVMGLEPTISCLGSKRSTTELHPQHVEDYSHPKDGCQCIHRMVMGGLQAAS